MLLHSSTTLHTTRAQAEALANANAAYEDEGGWTYKIIENATGKFVVQMYDEAGEFVATL